MGKNRKGIELAQYSNPVISNSNGPHLRFIHWPYSHTGRGVAKGGPGRAQVHPNIGCAQPIKI